MLIAEYEAYHVQPLLEVSNDRETRLRSYLYLHDLQKNFPGPNLAPHHVLQFNFLGPEVHIGSKFFHFTRSYCV
jgi:hypothetical protein